MGDEQTPSHTQVTWGYRLTHKDTDIETDTDGQTDRQTDRPARQYMVEYNISMVDRFSIFMTVIVAP